MGDPSGPGTHGGLRATMDPRPLGGLAALAELLGGDSVRSRRFLGGIAAGALVGAAVAGTALLRRRSTGRNGRG